MGGEPPPAPPAMPPPGFAMALSEAEVEAVVREVTDEEVAHYHEYGWVMMRGLVQVAQGWDVLYYSP